jgi:RHS repeat-associated protein
MVTLTNPREKTTRNEFDDAGRVVKQTDPAGGVLTFEYGAGTTTIVDPRGTATRYWFSAARQLTAIAHAYGTADEAVGEFEHDDDGNVVSETGPDGKVTTKTYDGRGDVLSMRDPLGRITRYTYTAAGDVSAVTDAAGRTTQFDYDAHGNLTQVTRPLDLTSVTRVLAYDPDRPGDLRTITDENGNTSSFTHDQYGNRTSATDPEGAVETTSYDVLGQITDEVDARGNAPGATPADHTTRYTRNAYGDPLTIVDPLGRRTVYEYDANQNVTASTDPKTHRTSTTYDALDRPVTTTRQDDSTIANQYDASGNRTSLTDGLNHTTTFTYDALGRQTAMTDPLGRRSRSSYDANSQMVSTTDAQGRATRLTYDAVGQVKAIDYEDAATPDVSVEYDAVGQRTRMADGTGTTTFAYDDLGRLVASTNGAGRKLGYDYDRVGNLTAIEYPQNLVARVSSSQDRTVTRDFDRAGRMTSVTDFLGNTTRFGYDAAGELVERRFPNGLVSTATRDDAGQVTRLRTDKDAATRFDLPSTRDPLGQVTETASTASPADALVQQLTYDAVNRLTTSSSSARTEQFTYDDGDRLTRLASNDGQAPLRLAYDDANQLTEGVRSTPAPALATYRAEVLADTPAGFWRLGEASGTVAADQTGASNATYPSAAVRGRSGALPGQTDTAVRVPGSGEIAVTDTSKLNVGTADFSVEAWVKTTVNGDRAIAAKATTTAGWSLAVTDDASHVGQARLELLASSGNVTAYSTPRVDDGRWHHVVASVSRQTGVTLYVDGQATARAGAFTANLTTTASFWIGHRSGASSFDGDLDEVAVYRSALSAARVRRHRLAAHAEDAAAPQPAVTAPAPSATTSDSAPTFQGTAAADPADAPSVMVDVYAGTAIAGTPVQSLTTTRADSGAWATESPRPLANGAYTAVASQVDLAGNRGASAPRTFTVANAQAVLYRTETLADTPAGFWRLGETSGTVATDQTGASNATYPSVAVRGRPGALPGQTDAAVRVPGSGEIAVTDTTKLNVGTANFTVEAWVKTTVNGDRAIVSKATSTLGWTLAVTDDSGHLGQARMQLQRSSTTLTAYSTQRVDDGKWHHIAASINRQTGTTILVDGLATTTTGSFTGDLTSTAAFWIAHRTGTTSLDGDLDEVALYRSALSVERIQRHHRVGLHAGDAAAPQPVLTAPTDGANTPDASPLFEGTAALQTGDDATVTVEIRATDAPSDDIIQTLHAAVGANGAWQAESARSLADGTYTIRVIQRDAAGNRGTSPTRTVTIAGSTARTTYTYDQIGQRTRSGSTSLTWDHGGRLSRYETPAAGSGPARQRAYTYDGDGLLSSLTWSQAEGLPTAVADDASLYVTGPDGLPLQTITAGEQVRWFHQDQLGSTRALTDASGATVATYDYDAFGAVRRTTGPAAAANPFRFTGQYSDDSGYIYLRARWYDPATGQFLSRDPIGFDGGTQNVYAYAANNSTNLVDPTGLWSASDNSDTIAGWGDNVTFGLTKEIRRQLGIDDVDYCSDAYRAGSYAGIAMSMVVPGGGQVRGLAALIKSGKYLGRGSTGRVLPATLKEKRALEHALATAAEGRPLPIRMTDPRWRAEDGWVKMAQNIDGVEVHYVYNPRTGAMDDFKFK